MWIENKSNSNNVPRKQSHLKKEMWLEFSKSLKDNFITQIKLAQEHIPAITLMYHGNLAN